MFGSSPKISRMRVSARATAVLVIAASSISSLAQTAPISPDKKSARLIKGAQEIYYPGRPHGLTATHQDEVNADLLKFLKSVQQGRKAA